MSLDDFFDSIEAEHARQEQLKDYALRLLETSTMRDDDDGLEDEIIQTQPTPERWREIFQRLQFNQLRCIDFPGWTKTEFNQSYKNHGIDN